MIFASGSFSRFRVLTLTTIVAAVAYLPVTAQEQLPPRSDPPLILTDTIGMPNVEGRIDHFAIDPGGPLFVCIVGNDTVEVLETVSEKRIHTINAVPHPQGAAYAPALKKLFVGSRDGKLYVYDGTSFDLLTSITFDGDVDNLRYDETGQPAYVAHGDGESAGIAVLDAKTNQRLSEGYKLGAHPKSFQLEKSGPAIFVNLPDLHEIAVINRNTRAIVGSRTPPRLLVFDTATGHVIASMRTAADSDDLYYDATYTRVCVPGGQGFVSVFQQNDADHYHLLAEIPSSLGARTAGYTWRICQKGRDRFYLAVPGRQGHSAEVWIYQAKE
jgi:hypothetical protein